MMVVGCLFATAAVAQSGFNAPFHSFDKNNMSHIVTAKGSHTAATLLKNTDILFEDFEGSVPALPMGWATSQVTDLEGLTVDAFITGDATQANVGGYWPVPDVPLGNNFAQANDDGLPCDCDMFLVTLTAPEVDLSSSSNPALSFDIFHDQGFGGGDAFVNISTDGGTTFNPLVTDDAGAAVPLAVDASVWQTVIIPLYDFASEASVTIQFTWSDAGSWASGFAVDNVGIGSLADFNVAADKVEFGDWNMEDIAPGLYPFSRVPLSQVTPVTATTVISNFGFNDLENVDFTLEVLMDGASQGTWTADAVPAIASLGKDTLSVITDWTPSGVGLVEIVSTVSSTTGDDVTADNMATNDMMITDLTYARDNNSAEAFTEAQEYGNFFDIYVDDEIGGISVCVQEDADGSEGAIFYCQLYEFLGFDAEGFPELEYVTETQEYQALAQDFTSVGENNFIDLPFDGAVSLEAGKTYMPVLVNLGGTDNVRMAVSGANEWPASWLFADGDWGWTLSIPMIRLNFDTSIAVDEVETAAGTVNQNIPNPATNTTRFSYTLNQSSEVTFQLFDGAGKLVMSEDMGTRSAGEHFFNKDVAHLPAGLYNYTINIDGVPHMKQMIKH